MSVSGLNLVGLKRRGLSNDDIRLLKEAYRLLFKSKALHKDRLQAVEDMQANNVYVDELLAFVRSSERGVMMHNIKATDV